MERGRGNRGRGGYGYGRGGNYRRVGWRGGYSYTSDNRRVPFEGEEGGWSGDQRNIEFADHQGSGGNTGMGTTRGRGGVGKGGDSRGVWGPSTSKGESGSSGNTNTTERSISPHLALDHVPNLQQNKTPKQLSSLSSPASVVRRPDNGEVSKAQTCWLRVNHFPVSFNPDTIIKHYDVHVELELPPNNGQLRIKKEDLKMIREKLFGGGSSSEFPSVIDKTGYDGENNIFSVITLPTGTFKVDLDYGDDSKHRTYKFTIKHVADLKLRMLMDYISGNASIIPKKVLQGMNVVMKENPSRHMICVGSSFHSHHQNDDIGFGLIASRGFQQSLRLTSQGLSLCLDYSTLALRKRLPVLDFLKEHIHGFNVSNFRNYKTAVESKLKGIKVTVTHRNTKQKYTVEKLTEKDTRHLTFLIKDPNDKAQQKKMYLVEYFRKKHETEIKYKDIPSLDLGTNHRENYVPMELCDVAEGQIYPKESLDKNDKNASSNLKKISLVKPGIRKKVICKMIQDDNGPCGGDTIQNFEIQVDKNMTSVKARVIDPPELKLSNLNGQPMKIKVENEKCQWNLVNRGVVKGKSIKNWAILDFSASKMYVQQFYDKFIRRCRNLGMDVSEPFYEVAEMHWFSNIYRLREILEKVKIKSKDKGQLQIVLCVMSKKDDGYNYLKWISETIVGVITQCCLFNNAIKANDQYLTNLALKINAKLGGSNAELCDPLPYFDGLNHIMFVGADVNHPRSNDKTSPSISAVVATMNWPAANRYAARIQPQDNRQEKIQNFGELCLELVKSHAEHNKGRPSSIVIFRDGVSESQFDMVLQEEIEDLKRRFQSINYFPCITVIIAQKRHHTRLFPENQKGGVSIGNVFPGTVVDTKIVHPFEFDFYLCSHYGSLGTSKPTHYHVLRDEHGFSSDKLQKLIFDMCFTFARCTKPVSLVPPVYYADLVAYRGRLYYDAWEKSSTSSIASSSFSSVASLDNKIYKLHSDIQDTMFFV